MSIRIIPPEEVEELFTSDYAPDEIRDEVNEVILHYIRKAEAAFSAQLKGKSLIFPDVVYDLTGHTAGQAVVHRNTPTPQHIIRLNLSLLQNPKTKDDMLRQTVPHEVAHVVVQQLFPRSAAHGGHWVWVMGGIFNLEPKRCHNYETKPARVHERVTYYCACEPPNNVHKITLRRRNSIVFDNKEYICKRCRQTIQNTPMV